MDNLEKIELIKLLDINGYDVESFIELEKSGLGGTIIPEKDKIELTLMKK
jgi:hypothetical protein